MISKKYIESDNAINDIKLGKYHKKKMLFIMIEDIKLEDCSVAYCALKVPRFNLYKNSTFFNLISIYRGTEFQEFLKQLQKAISDEGVDDKISKTNSN